ncbi:DUF2059 domain-containing protein [Palleronia abyssalis]|uniref:Uncharacterized protein n=1 Tax=Palleronia abyssalis TaxID=1501240 RepID=A0A2R8BQ24_9RHOB|nr:DUF2059 domain-containing protein [Palleronia abyssalis]SPJ22225.1 hypothetical protein PAA8504_00013 [Palleronia abyssalis]
MPRFFTAMVAAVCFAAPAQAQQEDAADLIEVLRLLDIVEIMRAEGADAAEELAEDLFPGGGRLGWAAEVARIYDVTRMKAEVEESFQETIPVDAIPGLISFFTDQVGQDFVRLEIEAREALADPDVEAAAEDAAQDAPEDLQARIDRFIEVNDLVEQNVSGTLNSNYAFFRGLADGGGPLSNLTEDQIIADVYASEPEVRDSTITWLNAYLTLAYTPMTDDDLDSYIALSESEAGQDLNRAIFAAFDTLYNDLSYELGRSAAMFMQGQDL